MGGCGKIVVLAYLVITVSAQTQDCADEALKQQCINPARSGGGECSGRGACVCGACKCYPRRVYTNEFYSGKYCQCDDYSCSYHSAQLCGGHGQCDCGTCKCDHGFTGDACECPTTTDSCIAFNGKLCNGVGVCKCGICSCSGNSQFRGPTCEECPARPGRCSLYKECALCKGFQKGQLSQEECDKECQHISIRDSLNKKKVQANDNVNMCQLTDEDTGCKYNFTYEYVDPKVSFLTIMEKQECPSSAAASHTNTLLGLAIGVVSWTFIWRFI